MDLIAEDFELKKSNVVLKNLTIIFSKLSKNIDNKEDIAIVSELIAKIRGVGNGIK